MWDWFASLIMTKPWVMHCKNQRAIRHQYIEGKNFDLLLISWSCNSSLRSPIKFNITTHRYVQQSILKTRMLLVSEFERPKVARDIRKISKSSIDQSFLHDYGADIWAASPCVLSFEWTPRVYKSSSHTMSSVFLAWGLGVGGGGGLVTCVFSREQPFLHMSHSLM